MEKLRVKMKLDHKEKIIKQKDRIIEQKKRINSENETNQPRQQFLTLIKRNLSAK